MLRVAMGGGGSVLEGQRTLAYESDSIFAGTYSTGEEGAHLFWL